jgi:glycosyltransferase involved in cell wall biosynthesis
MIAASPIRVLHVLGALNRGGIETWLLHVLRHADRGAFCMDFVVHTDKRGAYDDEARALGSRIHPCLHPRRPRQYARALKGILRDQGPYDIVHSHVHHYSGHVLRLARQAGVPVRIAHSHNDTSPVQARAGVLRRIYLASMERWIARHATLGLAASGKAAASLFGPSWHTDPRWKLLFYGIDLGQFRNGVTAAAVRAELNIPQNAFVVGHVGRFEHQKNHPFLVEIFAELARRHPQAVLLLVGEGALRPAIEKKVVDEGLTDRVIFAGLRSDVPRLMIGAMDVFLLPSWHEGLPMVLVETQAAGLPSVISDVIADETTLVEPLMRRVSLLQPPSAWAEEILALANGAPVIPRPEARSIVEQSSLSIQASVGNLERVYRESVSSA